MVCVGTWVTRDKKFESVVAVWSVFLRFMGLVTRQEFTVKGIPLLFISLETVLTFVDHLSHSEVQPQELVMFEMPT